MEVYNLLVTEEGCDGGLRSLGDGGGLRSLGDGGGLRWRAAIFW